MAVRILVAVGVLLAGVLPAQAKTVPEGVKVTSLWQYLGASAYAHCVRKEIGVVTTNSDATAASIDHARAACVDAVSKVFSKTTMNGGSFPPEFINEAQSIVPATQAYLFPLIDSLAPSENPIEDRTVIMLVFPDGSMRDVDDGQKLKLADVNYLILKAKD